MSSFASPALLLADAVPVPVQSPAASLYILAAFGAYMVGVSRQAIKRTMPTG